MNTYHSINTEYLRSSRTIETVLVSNEECEKLLFVYNYEGYSFRVFENHLALLHFFKNRSDNYLHFDSDEKVDEYLATVKL